MTWDFSNARDALDRPGGDAASEWSRLGLDQFGDHPLLSADFVTPLVRHFAGPEVLLARHSHLGNVRALTLLQPRRAGMWATFLPSQAPIAPSLIARDARLDDLFSALPGFVVGIDFLCQDSPYSGLADDRDNRAHEHIRHSTTTAAEVNTSFEEYWAARPKNLRRNMKRYFNRIAASTDAARLEVRTDLGELRAGLTRYGLLESAGWKATTGTAIHPNNSQGRFYSDILEGFGRRGHFRVYELYFGDRLAASRLCISNGAMLIVLKTTYDESLSALAPGRVLLYMLLEREFAVRQVSRIEFYTNANADSLSWATTSRDILHITHYRATWLRNLVTRLRPVRQSLRSMIARGDANSTAARSELEELD